MSPSTYDPKFGDPPEVPYAYCKAHGFIPLAGLTEAEVEEQFAAHSGPGHQPGPYHQVEGFEFD